MMKVRRKLSAQTVLLTSIAWCVMLSACAATKDDTTVPKTSGSLSGIHAVDILVGASTAVVNSRPAAQLGVFVSEYLTTAPRAMAAESALGGVEAQQLMLTAQQTIRDPDYDLLQAFGDALQVDVADLLNRSTDRQQALEAYTDALNNVAARSNDRYKELEEQLKELDTLARAQDKERSVADRTLKKAIKDKAFDTAGEMQKSLTELQAIFAETDLKRRQTQSLVDTLDDLLTLYGSKILAIDQNREALIAGIKVIDVPGADELQVLEKKRASRTGGRGGFDSLFEDL